MVLRLLTVIPNWLLFPLYYPVFLLEVAGKACRFCEIIRCESGSERLILMRDVWMVFVPYFSRYLFEVWIAPVKHFSDLTGLDDVSPLLSFCEIFSLLYVRSLASFRIITCFSIVSRNGTISHEGLPEAFCLCKF